MIGLVLAVIAGLLVVDVLLEVWQRVEGVRRWREYERDYADMRRTLDRTRRR